MKALRIPALVGSVLFLAVIVSPAGASGPVVAPAAAPASEAPSVTSIGVGVVQSSATDPLAVAQTLYITAQSAVQPAGVQSAADELVTKLDAIRAALVKVGVPADGVRIAGINVSPFYSPEKPMTAGGQPARVTSLNLVGSLTAEVPSIRVLIAAMNAATESGATSINANMGKGPAPYGAVQPSAADLTKATQAAVANARTNAEALASASGKKLGAIRSISSSQPPMMGCCPPSAGLTVHVTVTFDFAE